MPKIKIMYDTFGIAKRLKELDDGYFVIYDTRFQRFEVHNSKQTMDTFCIVVDGELDSRVLTKIRKTSSANINVLLSEIEENNNQLDKNAKKQFQDNVKWRAGEMFQYAKQRDNANFDYAYKTSWV